MGPVSEGYRVTWGFASRRGWRLWRQCGVGPCRRWEDVVVVVGVVVYLDGDGDLDLDDARRQSVPAVARLPRSALVMSEMSTSLLASRRAQLVCR